MQLYSHYYQYTITRYIICKYNIYIYVFLTLYALIVRLLLYLCLSVCLFLSFFFVVWVHLCVCLCKIYNYFCMLFVTTLYRLDGDSTYLGWHAVACLLYNIYYTRATHVRAHAYLYIILHSFSSIYIINTANNYSKEIQNCSYNFKSQTLYLLKCPSIWVVKNAFVEVSFIRLCICISAFCCTNWWWRHVQLLSFDVDAASAFCFWCSAFMGSFVLTIARVGHHRLTFAESKRTIVSRAYVTK